jgi:hypothetical protein
MNQWGLGVFQRLELTHHFSSPKLWCKLLFCRAHRLQTLGSNLTQELYKYMNQMAAVD